MRELSVGGEKEAQEMADKLRFKEKTMAQIEMVKESVRGIRNQDTSDDTNKTPSAKGTQSERKITSAAGKTQTTSPATQ